MEITTISDVKCMLGESPVWDMRRSCLHFVDILSSRIYSYKPDTGVIDSMETPLMPSAIAPCKDGNLVVATAEGIYISDIDKNDWRLLAHPEAHLKNNRYNDGKCDAQGRFWIGSMDQAEEANQGALYMVDKNGTQKTMLQQTTIANGMEWAEASNTYYHIDSGEASIYKYHYDAVAATITEKRTLVEFKHSEGVPDGMTMDEEGMLWVAHFGGSCVTRRNPTTGEVLTKVELPVSQVTSCCFGGDNFMDLFVTTAAKELSAKRLSEMPLSGQTFIIKNLGIKGVPPNEFG